MLLGCKPGSKLIEDRNIKHIRVAIHSDGNRDQVRDINIPESITKIVNGLNNCYREPMVFKAQYTLTIVYNDGSEKLVICNGSSIKVNGLTYKINRPITELIN